MLRSDAACVLWCLAAPPPIPPFYGVPGSSHPMAADVAGAGNPFLQSFLQSTATATLPRQNPSGSGTTPGSAGSGDPPSALSDLHNEVADVRRSFQHFTRDFTLLLDTYAGEVRKLESLLPRLAAMQEALDKERRERERGQGARAPDVLG
jgi:hypothetical protein